MVISQCYVYNGNFCLFSMLWSFLFAKCMMVISLSLCAVVVLPGERVASATQEDHTDDHTGDGQML